MISYEGSKWYIKFWRKRWYIYAILLHTKNFISVSMWIDLLMKKGLSSKTRLKLRNKWRSIIYNIELKKMKKLTATVKYERED
jgi:hypothetical protein